jgi:hypothetical protein
VAGAVLGFVVRIWVRTLRVRVDVAAGVDLVAEHPVFAFFHGQQMALLAARPHGLTVVLVSHSKDGEVQAGVLGALGFSVVRGSSTRGGARGLAEVVGLLRRGACAAFAVDGPRGPLGVAKGGAALAAGSSGASLLPVAAAARRAVVLSRAWDRFEIPLPFTGVVVVVGAPVSADAARSCPAVLASAIAAARARAEALLGESRASEGVGLERGA